jgi:hypothetical protein
MNADDVAFHNPTLPDAVKCVVERLSWTALQDFIDKCNILATGKYQCKFFVRCRENIVSGVLRSIYNLYDGSYRLAAAVCSEMLNSRGSDGLLSLDRAHECIVSADAAAQTAISILFGNIADTDKLGFYVPLKRYDCIVAVAESQPLPADGLIPRLSAPAHARRPLTTLCRRLRRAAFGHQETYANHFRMLGISPIHASATTQVPVVLFNRSHRGMPVQHSEDGQLQSYWNET